MNNNLFTHNVFNYPWIVQIQFALSIHNIILHFSYPWIGNCSIDNRGFHDKEIWCISVRLTDRSEVTRHKINLVKNCYQWDLNPWLPDCRSNAQLTVLGRNLLKIFEVSFLLFHAPLHMLGHLFLKSIEHDFIKAKAFNDSQGQPNSDLAQLAEQWPDDLKVVSSNPTGGNFWQNLFCSV